MNGRLVELKFGQDDIGELRDAYRDHVDLVDDWLGRLMDEVPDDVFMFVLADIGIALGSTTTRAAARPPRTGSRTRSPT